MISILLAAMCCSAWADAPRPAPTTDYLPNVVFIAVDTLRADHLGCYGYERCTTPNIDRLAAEGVLFENCYTAASWTLPSVMSVFTGLLPSSHGVVRENVMLPASVPTLPEEFRRVGYYCASVVSCPFLEAKYGFSRGFHVYDDHSVGLGVEIANDIAPDYKRHLCSVSDVRTGSDATQYAKLILRSDIRSGRPFFLFVHLFDPHDSYIAPSRYVSMFDPKYVGAMNGRGVALMRNDPPSGRDLERLISLYDAEIAFTDALIGSLVDEIDRVLDPSKTIILLFSDHGEAFGEHGLMRHGNNAHREEARTPMIWRWRGVLPGRQRIASPVSNTDITQTLKELLSFRRMKLLQGDSLWPLMLGRGGADHRHVLTQRASGIDKNGHNIALSAGRFRLHARFRQGPDDRDAVYELYDVVSDPWEQTNLAGLDLFSSQVTEMRSVLSRRWQETVEIQRHYWETTPGQEVDLTDSEKRRLRNMGYLK